MENGLCLQCADGHEDKSREARELLLRVVQQRRMRVCQGRKGELESQEPFWLLDVLSRLVPMAFLGGWTYHTHSTVE